MTEEVVQLNINILKLNKQLAILCDIVENLSTHVEDLTAAIDTANEDILEADQAELTDEEYGATPPKRSRSATGH